jgi:glycopeptide antibiotics resistance protein
MNSQIFPGVIAVLCGAVLGVLLFVPFVAVQYRRRGRLTLRQLALWAGFLVYGIALWTYTLLPLPASADDLICVSAQLQPLQFLADIQSYPASTPGQLARNPALMQVALNIALFAPLGFFLRLIWRRGLVVATAVGFGISLLIEFTQLTGVWGLYPCAYRLFDVDDLIANTFGALLGGVLSLALRPALSRTPADPDRPLPVTRRRRALGMLCDVLLMWLAGGVIATAMNVIEMYVLHRERTALPESMATWIPLVCFGVVTLVTGRTLGDMSVRIRWDDGIRPAWLRNIIRYAAGIGGWQVLLTYAGGLDVLWVIASLIALISTPTARGLAGLASRGRPVDALAP